jgi:hypothetical protein
VIPAGCLALADRGRALARELAAIRKPDLAILLLPLALAAAGSLAVLVLHRATGAPYAQLTRDPASTFLARPYVGFLSNAGVMLWVAAATTGLLAGWATRGRSALAPYLLAIGLLTALLAVDDLWLLHEDVLPALGVPERVAVSAYGIYVLALFAVFRRAALRTDLLPAALALACLGLSAWMDQELPFADLETLLEDVAKFAGIAFWLTYALRTARQALDESRLGA